MKRFCLHDWNPWSALANAYSGTKQFRSCKKCNKIILRNVACSNYTNLAEYNSEPINEQQAMEVGMSEKLMQIDSVENLYEKGFRSLEVTGVGYAQNLEDTVTTLQARIAALEADVARLTCTNNLLQGSVNSLTHRQNMDMTKLIRGGE